MFYVETKNKKKIETLNVLFRFIFLIMNNLLQSHRQYGRQYILIVSLSVLCRH